MSRTATLEQSIPEQVLLQKAVLVESLKQHREHINELIENLEKAQTLEELLSNMQTAAKNMI